MYPLSMETNLYYTWPQSRNYFNQSYAYLQPRNSKFQRKYLRNYNNKKWKKKRNSYVQYSQNVSKQDIEKWNNLQKEWRPIEKYIEKPKFKFNSNDDQVVTFRPLRYVKKSVLDIKFLNECLRAIEVETFSMSLNRETYHIKNISQLNTEFNFESLMYNLSNNYFINHITQMENPFLILQYELKKNQYLKENGGFKEKFLFHGTKYSSVREICINNFNWKLFGSATGYKYGQGVSFTPDFYYASHYGDKSFENVMILAKVLVNKHSIGNQSTVIPPDKNDTTTNDICSVYVKYEDNTFYPSFIINYQNIFPYML